MLSRFSRRSASPRHLQLTLRGPDSARLGSLVVCVVVGSAVAEAAVAVVSESLELLFVLFNVVTATVVALDEASVVELVSVELSAVTTQR